MREIRCGNKFFGQVSENSTGEFLAQCSSKFCKSYPTANEIVEHYWDLSTSEHGIIKPAKTVLTKIAGSERKN